jgi:hypothetical protein
VRDLLAHAADIASGEEPSTTTEGAIRSDPLLNDAQKSALLAVYRSMVDPGAAESTERAEPTGFPGDSPNRAPNTRKKRAPTTSAPRPTTPSSARPSKTAPDGAVGRRPPVRGKTDGVL